MNTETHSTSSGQAKTCQRCHQKFTIEPEDFAFYEKVQVPPPTWCPKCRFLRRCMFRNETSLYKRTCDACKQPIISIYNPQSPYTVYCIKCWDSDQWDPLSYGADFDPAVPFFDQLGDLFKRVPKKAVFLTATVGQNVNSEYVNGASGVKNCYLVFNTGDCEEVLYSRGMRACRDSADLYYGGQLERCYETVNVHQSNGVQFGQNAIGTMDSMFVRDVSGLQNCFGCVNLRNKTHHFFNEPLSKDEYEKRVGEIKGSHSKTEEMKKKFHDFSLRFPRREDSNLKTVNSEGDYLLECKNVYQGFEAVEAEDCRYMFSVKRIKDSQDVTGYGWGSELLYECQGVGSKSQRVKCSFWVEECRDVEYSYALRNSAYCFGADGLKNGRYVILNKKYSEEEYRSIRDRIVAQLTAGGMYGAFMPQEIAPFAYNETAAQENFPLSKEEALALGFRWEDSVQMTRGRETMKPEEIPDHIRDAPDSITGEVFACAACGRNYRIIPQELQFYRRLTVPIPRRCFYCRHHDRIRRRGPLVLFDRACARCANPVKTTYAPERPEVIYCKACYQAEVV